MKHDARPAARFAVNGHLSTVATEEVNVRLNPLEGLSLVEQAGVGCSIVRWCAVKTAQEAKRGELRRLSIFHSTPIADCR